MSVLATFALANVVSELIAVYAGPLGRAAATPAPALPVGLIRRRDIA